MNLIILCTDLLSKDSSIESDKYLDFRELFSIVECEQGGGVLFLPKSTFDYDIIVVPIFQKYYHEKNKSDISFMIFDFRSFKCGKRKKYNVLIKDYNLDAVKGEEGYFAIQGVHAMSELGDYFASNMVRNDYRYSVGLCRGYKSRTDK